MSKLYRKIAKLRLKGYTVDETARIVVDSSDTDKAEAERRAKRFYNISREVSTFVSAVLISIS